MWLIFLMLILLTRFSQRGSLVSVGGQCADHVPRGCSKFISISRRWGWAKHLPGGCPDRGPWSTGGKWAQRRAALVSTPIPDLICSLCLVVVLCWVVGHFTGCLGNILGCLVILGSLDIWGLVILCSLEILGRVVIRRVWFYWAVWLYSVTRRFG